MVYILPSLLHIWGNSLTDITMATEIAKMVATSKLKQVTGGIEGMKTIYVSRYSYNYYNYVAKKRIYLFFIL